MTDTDDANPFGIVRPIKGMKATIRWPGEHLGEVHLYGWDELAGFPALDCLAARWFTQPDIESINVRRTDGILTRYERWET